VAGTAVDLCRYRFDTDPSKSFFLYDGAYFNDRGGVFAADLAISLDVVYHLIEDTMFEQYVTHLFSAAQRFVVVYPANMDIADGTPHVRHRNFTGWMEDNCPQWRSDGITPGPYAGSEPSRLLRPPQGALIAHTGQISRRQPASHVFRAEVQR
jgi:hypothetical protein